VVISFSGGSGTSLHASAPANGTAGTAIAPGSIGADLSGGSAPSGTIAFIVFGPQSTPPTNCTSGGTTIGNPRGASGDGIYHPSTGFTPPAAGDYWWYARYSGDSNNSPAASPCGGAMPETVVSPASSTGGPPPPTTVLSPNITKFHVSHKHDRAKFTFSASGASGFVCALVRVPKHHKHKHKPHFSSCTSPAVYKHLKPGNYIFKVKSLGANGAKTTATTQSFTI
jgi:hypothetical protein